MPALHVGSWVFFFLASIAQLTAESSERLHSMEFLHQFFKSAYVRMLEEENLRLRIENRAFLNSLLGTVGHPPLGADEPGRPVSIPRKRSWPQLLRSREEASRNKHANGSL
jgi:hypothetical protein